MAEDPIGQVIDVVVEQRRSLERCMLVGVAGGVAAGKSTLAASIARRLTGLGLVTAVASTDGFLYPNALLAELGLLDRKGFPESYDSAAIEQFLDSMLDGSPVEVPVYDHHIYDIVAAIDLIEPGDVVVVEGVNALQFAARFDLSIYVDASPDDLEATWIARAIGLRDRARTEYSPFFDEWTRLPDESFMELADQVWNTVNLPNLRDHIEPTRDLADFVIERAADHSIRSVTRRTT